MKKNTRIKHRKYNSRKKFVFPLIGLTILLVISVAGVFAAQHDRFTDDNGIKYRVKTEAKFNDQDVLTENGEVVIIGYEPASLNIGELVISGTVSDEKKIDQKDVSKEHIYNITNIQDEAFDGCNSLTKLDLSGAENLETIGGKAFRNCTNMTEIICSDDDSAAKKLTIISVNTFQGCTGLTKIDFTSTGLSRIDKAAFMNCYNLHEVKFPDSINQINEEAFAGCVWLTKLTGLADNSNVTIASGDNAAFYGCCYLDDSQLPANNTAANNNPDPFGNAYIIKDLKTRLQGLSIDRIVAADGIEEETIWKEHKKNGKYVPLRIFRDMGNINGGDDSYYTPSYKIYYNTNPGHEIVGMKLLGQDDAIPSKYEIDTSTFTELTDNEVYSFAIPSNWANDPTYIFAIATRNGETEGAPIITTTSLESGVKGESYECQLIANSSTPVTWSVEDENGNKVSLPDGFTLNSNNGWITSNEIKATPGTYEFVFVADNGISSDKMKLALEVFDNQLDEFARNSLWWEESGGKVSVAWKPLVSGSKYSIDYTIQIYDEDGNPVGYPFTKKLNPGTFDSTYASEDVTSILEKNGKSTYYFTIKAESQGYGTSSASSKGMPKGELPYGYAEYTITATATGPGTGKISLSNSSYDIFGIKVDPLGNGVEVTVLETSITRNRPLEFIFTPDKGCEVTALTVNGVAIRKDMEHYVIRSMDEIPAAAADNNDSSSGNSGSSGGVISGSGSTSGVLNSRASNSTLNADETNTTLNAYGSEDLDIVVEFGLISNNIDGNIIMDGTYVQGERASFQAIGDGMNDVPMVDGVTRWVPKYWWLDDEKKTATTTTHTWTDNPYTDAIDTTNLSLGTHTLYVAFQKQNYVGSTGQWVDAATVNSTDVRAADFVVTDRQGNDVDPDAPGGTDGDSTTDSETPVKDKDKNNNGKDKNGGGSKGDKNSGIGSVVDRVTSTLSNVRTGDDMTMALWIALALVSLIGIGFCVRQIIKH